MSVFRYRFAKVVAAVMLILPLTPALRAAAIPAARPATGSAEAVLFDAANRDRAAAGLPLFQWDPALAASALQHAEWMARRNTLSHQFPGEPPLQQRAMQSGARFSLIAENVAEGPSAGGLHKQWMNSAPHRANLLDHDLNAVGIAVVRNGNLYFAVEDFSEAVPAMSLDEQEEQVARLLAAQGMRSAGASPEARMACTQDRGWGGERPRTMLRYETADLSRLPDDVVRKVRSGRYQSAGIGACEAGGETGFARFRIAILLY